MLNDLLILKNWQEKILYNKVSHTLLFEEQFTLRLNSILANNKSELSIPSGSGTGPVDSLKKSFDSQRKSKVYSKLKKKNNSLSANHYYLIDRFKLMLLVYLIEYEVILRENYPLASQTFGCLNKDTFAERYFDKLEWDLKDCIKLSLAQKKSDEFHYKWSRDHGYYQVFITYGKANECKVNEFFIDFDSPIDFNGFEENIMKWCMEGKYMICELPAALSTEDMVDLLLRLTKENEGTFLPFYHKNILTTNKEIKSITYCGEELFFNPIKTDDKKLLQLNKCMRAIDNEYSYEETFNMGIELYILEIIACLAGGKLRGRIKRIISSLLEK